ncbi:radical SAM protein [bacterium]|nr:radical SAM protein [bacterium]
MEIIASSGREDVAIVYIARTEDGGLIEFVEALQPPLPRREKWVLIISTMFGCPIKCLICDAHSVYQGKLSKEQMLDQIDYLIAKRFGSGPIPVRKFKIQFARMGEPALNEAVLDVLKELPTRYPGQAIIPVLSTIAPLGTETFFQELLDIKNASYGDGRFQLQFSIHSSDEHVRDRLIPVRKWTFKQIADYGERLINGNDRKVTLNFALAKNIPVNPKIIRDYFNPTLFFLKLTPVNPTYSAIKNNIVSSINPWENTEQPKFIDKLKEYGYDVLLSIGEPEENLIGSNCGQFIQKHLNENLVIKGAYTYSVNSV